MTDDRQLAKAFKVWLQMRVEMRASGATDAECTEALKRVLKANWSIPDVSEWPYHMRLPRCVKCDGYGLIITNVVDRLGQSVTQGEPCTCEKGRRFMPQKQAEQDFTQAGKVEKPKKGFQRWGG